jgi:hypothetical protein
VQLPSLDCSVTKLALGPRLAEAVAAYAMAQSRLAAACGSAARRIRQSHPAWAASTRAWPSARHKGAARARVGNRRAASWTSAPVAGGRHALKHWSGKAQEAWWRACMIHCKRRAHGATPFGSENRTFAPCTPCTEVLPALGVSLTETAAAHSWAPLVQFGTLNGARPRLVYSGSPRKKNRPTCALFGRSRMIARLALSPRATWA